MSAGCEVVITGLGVVSPIGIGCEPFWRSLASGTSGIRTVDLFDSSSLSVRFGGQIPDFDPKLYVRPRKSLKVMSRDIQLGFAAADLTVAVGIVSGAEAKATAAAVAGVALAAQVLSGGVRLLRLDLQTGAAAIAQELPLSEPVTTGGLGLTGLGVVVSADVGAGHVVLALRPIDGGVGGGVGEWW
jgi:3-oxoacyl-(acyl-carrier-protein) synthase